ncbi:MAG: FkbM family methyltransferase [Candidatus Micrarchaeia archaeon]
MILRIKSLYFFVRNIDFQCLKYSLTVPSGTRKLFGYKIPFDLALNKSELFAQLYHFVNDVSFKYFSLIKPRVIFDLGASYGILSLNYHKKFPYAKIYSFEPNPITYNFAKSLFEINKVTDRIYLFNDAVGDREEERELYYNPWHLEGSSLFEQANNSEKVRIRMIRFVDFIQREKIENIDFLKVDIEGGEFDLLRDLDESKTIDIISKIFMEVHSKFSDIKRTSLSKILEILEKNCFFYKVCSTGDDGENFRTLVWAWK